MQVYAGASLQKRLEAFGKQISASSGQLESLSKTILSEKRRFPNQGTGTVIHEPLLLLTQFSIKIVITIQQGGLFRQAEPSPSTFQFNYILQWLHAIQACEYMYVIKFQTASQIGSVIFDTQLGNVNILQMGRSIAKHQTGWGGKDISPVFVCARIVLSNTACILTIDILCKLMKEI